MEETSIDWFLNNLPQRFKNALVNTCQEEIKQAKEKERQHIIEARRNGFLTTIRVDERTHEEYYDQTYNQQEDKTFKQKSKWTTQKQHIIDIMKADEDAGLYDENN